jgi:hypothetical protein
MTETIDSISVVFFWGVAAFVAIQVIKDSINPRE